MKGLDYNWLSDDEMLFLPSIQYVIKHSVPEL